MKNLLACFVPLLVLAGCDGPPGGDAPATSPSGAMSSSGESMVSEAPAEPIAIDWRNVDSGDGRWRIAWRPVGGPLPVSEPCAIDLRITDAEGRPLEDRVEVIFDAEMPHHGHGMNVEPRMTRRADRADGWLVEGILLHMPGRWEASVDVSVDGEIERAQWTMDIKR